MPAYFFHVNSATGKTLSVTVERLSDGFVFKPSASIFVDPLTVVFSQKRTPLVEGSSENAYGYAASIANLSGTNGLSDPGLVRFRVHDESASNKTIAFQDAYVVGGSLVYPDKFVSTRATSADVSAEILTSLTNASTGVRMPELSELPPSNPTVAQALMLLYMAMRNASSASGTTQQYTNDGGTPLFECPVSDDGSSFTRDKLRNVT